MIKESFNEEILSKKLEKTLIRWKAYGAVSTPKVIVDLMVELSEIRGKSSLEILEPACGLCNFLLNIYSKFPDRENKLFGVELNKDVYLEMTSFIEQYSLPVKLINEDFLLLKTPERFDLVIGNPPYGIIGRETHYRISTLREMKAEYKKQFCTWKGKYNVYGAFIEKSINLLKDKGRLVFIIPATWMILDEFSALREYLSQKGKTKVYYLGRNVFKGIEVTSSIIVFEKGKKGVELYHKSDEGGFHFVLDKFSDIWDGDILRFSNEYTKSIEKNSVKLGDLFDIKISARSPELRNFKFSMEEKSSFNLPVLNGRNLKKGLITRDNYTGIWINKTRVCQLKKFYGIVPRAVVGHTKGGKIVAAIEDEVYPYVGDVYHLLPKRKITRRELEKILTWLNSEEMEEYVRMLYKEISPHITKTQLLLIPIKFGISNERRLFYEH
jgi:adenine-specific DNA-methyltransferase